MERIARGELGAKLRSQVAAWHPGASREQVEDAFQDACLRAAGRCCGQSEGEVFTWLRTTTHRELGHMRRRARREVLMDAAAPEFHAVAASDATPERAIIEQEAEAETERLTRAVLARLSDREREVIALHSHGRQRAEIAQHLGITPRSVKRAIERTMAEGRDELVRLAGRGCESGEALVARLAFGLASTGERRRAQFHLVSCPRCGALYERLHFWREQVAALLPLPVAAQAHPGVFERALHATADALANARQRVGGAREHVSDSVAHVKQQASAAYSRVVDPTPLAGVRPGAAAATVAGCLALGGGATVCVERGLDPTHVLTGAASQKRAAHSHGRQKAAAASAAPTPTATPTPQITPLPSPTAAPSPQPTATPAPTSTPEPPAPQDEYEPVTPAPEAQTTQARSTPTQPAPAPASGPGEFDGP